MRKDLPVVQKTDEDFPIDSIDDSLEVDALPAKTSVKSLSLRDQICLAVAGVLAGITSRTLTAPLERVKVMAQTGRLDGNQSIIRQAWNLLRSEGLRAMWRGNTANCMKVAPQKVIRFVGYENMKQLVAANPQRATPAEDFISSSSIACISVTLVFPLDTIKTRAQLVMGTRPKSSVQIALEAQRRLYRGLTPALLSAVPFGGVSMTVFMQSKNLYKDYYGLGMYDLPPVWVLMGIGAFSNFAAQLFSYPLYSIKANMQSQEVRESTWECARSIVRQRGVLGLYHGLSMNVIKAVPSVSISFAVYEYTKTIFRIGI